MNLLYLISFFSGFLLTVAACWANPTGASRGPIYTDPIRHTRRGPYYWMRHPMYIGTWLMIVGAAGKAAGAWNAIAVGMLAELLLREWAWRESQPPKK